MQKPFARWPMVALGSAATLILYVVVGRRRPVPSPPDDLGIVVQRPNRTAGALRALSDGGTQRDERRSPLPLALGLAVASCGVLLIALAFAVSRDAGAHADALLWAGRVLLWLPLMLLALAPRVPDRHRIVAIVAQAAMQSFVKWLYAPRDFRFPDELQHVRTAIEVQAHHTLSVQNPMLPVSPSYPGLEAVTNAVSSIAGIGIFAAGTVVASAVHIALAVCLFCLFRQIGLHGRLAAGATLLSALAPLHPFFNTSFLYAAPALLLMVATIAQALDVRTAPRVTGALCIVFLAALDVTHHVTTWATLIVLALAAVVARFSHDLVRWRRLLVLLAIGLGLTAIWTTFEASSVVTYVGEPITAAFSGLTGGKEGQALPTSASPAPAAMVLSLLAFLVGAVLVAFGVRPLWRRGDTGLRLAAVASVGFYAVLAVRVATGNGELAGRGFTYAFLFASVPMAVAALRIWSAGAPPWRSSIAGGMLTVLFAGLTIGFPPTWDAMPGAFRVAGDLRGVDERNTVASRWAASGLGLGWRMACDKGSCTLFGAYGRQEAINNASPLFYTTSFDAQTDRYVRDTALDFAVIDKRLGLQRPITGSYFNQDVGVGTNRQPIPAAALQKFDRAAHVSRVYDNGTVRIYDLREAGRRAR